MGGAHRGMVLAAVQWTFKRQSQDHGNEADGAQPDDASLRRRSLRDGWPVFTPILLMYLLYFPAPDAHNLHSVSCASQT